MSTHNENGIQLESEFNKLNIIDKDSNPVNINHKDCSPSCKECVPRFMIEGSSGNNDIDKFIKDSIYNAKYHQHENDYRYYPLFLEWVSFDRFEDIKQIGEGGFAKVFSAIWVDGEAKYVK